MILYSLAMRDSVYAITKWDDDLNVESTYTITATACNCPQGFKPTCRHRRMFGAMLPRVNTPWFYCYDTRQWHDSTGEAKAEATPTPTPEPTVTPFRRRPL